MPDPKDRINTVAAYYATLPDSPDGTPRLSESDFPTSIDGFPDHIDNTEEKMFAQYFHNIYVSIIQTQTILKSFMESFGVVSAIDVFYDNTVSGLSAANVQEALDEVLALIPTTLGDLSDVDLTGVSIGQGIQWTGTGWAPATFSGGGGGPQESGIQVFAGTESPSEIEVTTVTAFTAITAVIFTPDDNINVWYEITGVNKFKIKTSTTGWAGNVSWYVTGTT